MPFVLSLGESNPAALYLSVMTGVAAFLLTVLTDHHLGVFRILRCKLHQAVDLAVCLTFLVVPSVFRFGCRFFWGG